MSTESAILYGRTWHRRHTPLEHGFVYPLGMLWVDLARVDEWLDRHWLWGRRWRPVTFRDRDFLDGSDGPLDERVRAKAGELGLDWKEGTVMLLGQPRTLGLLFNPLVLYCHYPPGAQEPATVIAEVRNTPWKECHWYALRPVRFSDGAMGCRHAKAFHVSPFLDMAMNYHWRLRVRERAVSVRIENRRDDGVLLFVAGFSLRRLAEPSREMGYFVFRSGLQGILTRVRIYRQAWKLWRKGVPVQQHPGRTSP